MSKYSTPGGPQTPEPSQFQTITSRVPTECTTDFDTVRPPSCTPLVTVPTSKVGYEGKGSTHELDPDSSGF